MVFVTQIVHQTVQQQLIKHTLTLLTPFSSCSISRKEEKNSDRSMCRGATSRVSMSAPSIAVMCDITKHCTCTCRCMYAVCTCKNT